MRGLAPAAALLWLCLGGTARADDLVDYQAARNAYDAGEWGLAAERFEALLEREPAPSRAIREETLQYLGAARLFLGERSEADAAFERLLILEPEWELDAATFPTPILDEFSRVKGEMRERLLALQAAEQQAAEAQRRARLEEYRRSRAALEDALEPRYVARLVDDRELYLALVPLGVGQFQNGEDEKGWAFFGMETILAVADIWTFWAWDWYTREWAQAGDNSALAAEAAGFADGYKIASWTLLGALVAVVLGGIIDALVEFEDPGTVWRALEPDEVPAEYRLPSRDPDEFLPPPEGLEDAAASPSGFNLQLRLRF